MRPEVTESIWVGLAGSIPPHGELLLSQSYLSGMCIPERAWIAESGISLGSGELWYKAALKKFKFPILTLGRLLKLLGPQCAHP